MLTVYMCDQFCGVNVKTEQVVIMSSPSSVA